MPSLALLPGKYAVRAHALDPEGLYLFDHVEVPLTVTGESRELGLVRLEHEWRDVHAPMSGWEAIADLVDVVERDDAAAAREVGALFRRLFGDDLPGFPRHFVLRYVGAGAPVPLAYAHFTPWEGCYLGGGMAFDERAYRRMDPCAPRAHSRRRRRHRVPAAPDPRDARRRASRCSATSASRAPSASTCARATSARPIRT